jgi:hypothetical protein
MSAASGTGRRDTEPGVQAPFSRNALYYGHGKTKRQQLNREKLKMTIRNNIAAAALAVTVLVVSAAAAMASPAIANGNANVRNHPGGSTIGYLHDGQPVNVLGCNGNWCKVQRPGPDGWVKVVALDFGGYSDSGYYGDGGYYGGYSHHPHHPHFGGGAGVCLGGPGASFCIHD